MQSPLRLLLVVIFGLVLLAVTAGVIELELFEFLTPYRLQLIAAELAIIGIVSVEVLSSFLNQRARLLPLTPESPLRPAVRFIGYAVLGVSLVSLLSASPALAVGVGSVTGLVVGLAAQNIIGNALAGTILAIVRPFQIGSEITVMGLTGRVVEVGSIYTLIDLGDSEALIPNTALLTSAIRRAKSDLRR